MHRVSRLQKEVHYWLQPLPETADQSLFESQPEETLGFTNAAELEPNVRAGYQHVITKYLLKRLIQRL